MGVITEFPFQKVIKSLMRNEAAVLVSMVGGGGGAAKGTKRSSWRGEFGGRKGNAVVMEAEGRGPFEKKKVLNSIGY